MSSPENPPPPRTSASEPPLTSPVTLFDAHLRFLSDSYIGFFQERKRIEEIYVDSLLKLHRKCKSIDQYLDERIENSTARGAWGEIRDNVEREADTRVAFITTLNTDVISPLLSLKETQERIRKRIRVDLKEAIASHSDYAENVYPKLKRAYLKKSQEVEDLKTAASQAPPMTPLPTSDSNFTNVKPTHPPPTRPIVTAPQPLRPLERRASGSVPITRNRSPSSSTTLQDLAHQGKKHMNQLMTFLDKNNVKDTLSGRSDTALRSVRAKREADEADKEYRKSVHYLETLRIRRVKLLESGYNSLESFIRESSETVKHVLERYTDNLSATAATQSQLCGHARRTVEMISPERDTLLISNHIPRLLATATPKPVYYYNYTVGECKDLIFGVSLVDYATSRALPEGEIPKIVKLCIKEIDERGLNTEGIYRVSGRHALVLDLQHKIERNEAGFAFHQTHDDVFAISSLLKLYLRELPEPVFKFSLQDRVQHTEAMEEHVLNDFVLLRSKIRRLPPVHQATLKAIVEHLSRVAARAEKNKMDARNLAISFGTVIFGEDDMPKGNDLLNIQSWKDTLMEDLITHSATLFQHSSNQSPPLPPAPLGEAPPPVTYGSTHTRVAKVVHPVQPAQPVQPVQPMLPPRPLSPRSQDPYVIRTTHSEGPHRKNASEDFTPQLPSNPANSIHPSLRSGATASPARQSLPPPSRSAKYFEEQVPYAQYADTTLLSAPPGAAPSSPRKRDQIPLSSPLASPWSDGAATPSTITPSASTRTASQESPTSTSSSLALDHSSLGHSEGHDKRSTGSSAISTNARPPPASPQLPSRLQVMSSVPSSTSSTETAVPGSEVLPPTPPRFSSPDPPSPAATSDTGTIESYVDARRGSMSSIE